MSLFFWFNQFLDSRAEILEIISLVFWKKLSLHKDIIKPFVNVQTIFVAFSEKLNFSIELTN